MEVNWDSVVMMVKFAGGMLGILAIVYILACVTPWLAKKVDKLRGKAPAVEKMPENIEEAAVKGLYDAQKKASDEKEEPYEVKGIYDVNKKEASEKEE